MANIGDQLTNPESGMKRIDDTFYAIKFSGNGWTSFNNGDINYNNGTGHSNNKKGEYYEIYCYTSKFNIIANYANDLSNDIDVFVNSEKENISQYNSTTKTKICIFKKEFEKKRLIHLKVVNNTNNYITLDAIDIDEDGYIIYCDDNNKLYYDVTPIMTSNNTPSPYVAYTDNKYGSSWDAWKAFNGTNIDADDAWNTNSNIDRALIQLYFGSKTKVSAILINTRYISSSGNNPLKIEVQTSEDGTQFETVNDFSNIQWGGDNSLNIFNLKNTIKSEYCRLECVSSSSKTIILGQIRFLLAVDTPFFLIKDNSTNKIYNYDEDSNSLIEVTDISILKENALNNTCIYDLNKTLSLIDLRQSGIKILTNKNVKSKIKSIKSTKQLIIANNDFSTRMAENIDYFKFDYSLLNENCIIKTVISIDSGLTWYSNIDENWTLLHNKVPLKSYEELSSDEKQQWDLFLNEVLEKGINIQDVENLDFNILNSEKIRFVYAIQIEDTNSEAILKNLKWQFDSIGTYEQLSPKTEVNIAMTNNEIKIQPLKDIELMKINVGISSQNNVPEIDTSNLLDKETFKGKEIDSVKKADVAKNLENLSEDNLNKLINIINLFNSTNPQQYLGTNTENELGLYYLPTTNDDVGNSIEQRVALNVKSGEVIPIETIADMQDQKAFIQVYKFEEGEQDVISTLKEFNNANKDNFIYSDNVEFDDTCHIKNKYVLQNTLNDSTGLYETKVNKTEFLDLFSLTSEVNE